MFFSVCLFWRQSPRRSQRSDGTVRGCELQIWLHQHLEERWVPQLLLLFSVPDVRCWCCATNDTYLPQPQHNLHQHKPVGGTVSAWNPTSNRNPGLLVVEQAKTVLAPQLVAGRKSVNSHWISFTSDKKRPPSLLQLTNAFISNKSQWGKRNHQKLTFCETWKQTERNHLTENRI